MSEIAAKDDIVDGLRLTWAEMLGLLRTLNPEELAIPTALPGWSVQDNAAHVVGTERMLNGEPSPEVEPANLSHVRNDIGRANEAWVEHYRQVGAVALIEDFDRVITARLKTLEAMSSEEFDAASWTPAGHATFGRFMQIRLYDSWFHLVDMRYALDPSYELGDIPPEIPLLEVSNGLGYVVGKKAQAPDGASVRFAIGSDRSRWRQVVVAGGRASLVGLDFEPDVTLRMTPLAFFLTVGGRCPAKQFLASGAISVDGDEALGANVLANMAFTI